MLSSSLSLRRNFIVNHEAIERLIIQQAVNRRLQPSVPLCAPPDRPQNSRAQRLSGGLDWKKSLLVRRGKENAGSVQSQRPLSHHPD